MSNLMTEAADAIRRAAKQHEIYVKAAEALEQIGSIKQAAGEAEAAAKTAVAQREQALAQLAQAQASAVETVRIVGAERDAARAEVARLTAENDFLNGGAVADKQGIDILLAENERLTAALAEADGALSGCNDEILELRAAMRQPAPAPATKE